MIEATENVLYIQLRNGLWWVWSGYIEREQEKLPCPNKRDKKYKFPQDARAFAEYWMKLENFENGIKTLEPYFDVD